MAPPGVSVLAAVPGISDRTARTLLERFGSVGGVLRAGPECWAEVAGIGTVRAHALAVALLDREEAKESRYLTPAAPPWPAPGEETARARAVAGEPEIVPLQP